MAGTRVLSGVLSCPDTSKSVSSQRDATSVYEVYVCMYVKCSNLF